MLKTLIFSVLACIIFFFCGCDRKLSNQGIIGENEGKNIQFQEHWDEFSKRIAELEYELKQQIEERQDQIDKIVQELNEQRRLLDDSDDYRITPKPFIMRSPILVFDDPFEVYVRNLINKQPQVAVEIMSTMDEQEIIEIFLMTEEITKKEEAFSMIPIWLSVMESEKVNELQRKIEESNRSIIKRRMESFIFDT